MTEYRRTSNLREGGPLLTPAEARRFRCWACGERATDVHILIEGDRAVGVEGACAEERHDLLGPWDVAAAEGDPLAYERANRLLRGRVCYGVVPVAELLDPEEGSDWERHLRSKVWGRDAIALLRAVGRP